MRLAKRRPKNPIPCWLGIAPSRKGCGLAVLDDRGQPRDARTVPWRALAASLRALSLCPSLVVVGEAWRHRWVQALVRSLFPDALLVLVRRPEAPHPDPAHEALSLLRHYLERERLR